jgi:myo-inositol 2-dehydrogenase / D-chiro-inositol 1-dehydrogenase
MSDIEWQVRNWYNFVWTCGDSLVEQAVHNADKIMWLVRDTPPVSAVAVGGRAVPAHGGNIYDHFEVNYLFPDGYRVFLANRQATGCYNATHDYVMGTDGTLLLGGGRPRIEAPDGRIVWQFEGEEYDMYQREHDVLFEAIRSGRPKNDDLNLATSTLLAIMGRQAAYTGQLVTWEQSLSSELRLVPDPVRWDMAHDGAGAGSARPGQDDLTNVRYSRAGRGVDPDATKGTHQDRRVRIQPDPTGATDPRSRSPRNAFGCPTFAETCVPPLQPG